MKANLNDFETSFNPLHGLYISKTITADISKDEKNKDYD